MKCEECGEREATVHFTEIVENEKREMHLCEECARGKSVPLHKAISLTDLLAHLLKQVTAKELGELAGINCPSCGISYAEFRASGRLGCPHDYLIFRKPLTELLEKIQHDVRHVGKVPPEAGRDLARQNELVRLRRELERAAQREEYEVAAKLRDRIVELTRSLREGR